MTVIFGVCINYEFYLDLIFIIKQTNGSDTYKQSGFELKWTLKNKLKTELYVKAFNEFPGFENVIGASTAAVNEKGMLSRLKLH